MIGADSRYTQCGRILAGAIERPNLGQTVLSAPLTPFEVDSLLPR